MIFAPAPVQVITFPLSPPLTTYIKTGWYGTSLFSLSAEWKTYVIHCQISQICWFDFCIFDWKRTVFFSLLVFLRIYKVLYWLFRLKLEVSTRYGREWKYSSSNIKQALEIGIRQCTKNCHNLWKCEFHFQFPLFIRLFWAIQVNKIQSDKSTICVIDLTTICLRCLKLHMNHPKM